MGTLAAKYHDIATLDEMTVEGRRFLRADWSCSICYPGVIEQYREDKEYDAGHLFLYPDGTYKIEHIDKYNPDRGHIVEHGIVDVLPKIALGVFVLIAGVALLPP